MTTQTGSLECTHSHSPKFGTSSLVMVLFLKFCLKTFVDTVEMGHTVADRLRNCGASRKVAGSIPDCVIGTLH